MKIKKINKLIFFFNFLLILSGCGSASGDGTPTPLPSVNQLPNTNAGPDQIAGWAKDVSLSGSATDADGTISSYSWLQKSGSSVTLSDSTLANSSFVSPSSDTTLVFDLTTTDNDGGTFTDTIIVIVKSEFIWSEAATWWGSLPDQNDSITIPYGVTVSLDVSSITVADLTIEGILIFGAQDISLNADWILISGELHIGSENVPFTHQATITLTGDTSQDIHGHGSRGLFVMGGTLSLHGNAPSTTWTQISQHIQPKDSQLTVLASAGWKNGDQLVLAPTDFYEYGGTQVLTVSDITSNDVTVFEQVTNFHWGLLQYATTSGVSLVQDGSITGQGVTPLKLDQRAEIGNLTRNIVIQSIDDTEWQTNGFGAQVMIMDEAAVVEVDGVEFTRSGQAGLLGRYPFHWHELSYAPDGTELTDVNGHYVRNSSIHNSANRCVVIHATNGVEFKNNICYNIKGHAVFFEDAVERRNVIEDNLILTMRAPSSVNALQLHELEGENLGPSGIWATNPDNTIRNNVIADAQGFGLWMAFPAAPLGTSKSVDITPNRLDFGNFDYNKVHSNNRRGLMFDFVPFDDAGNTSPLQYWQQTGATDPSCVDSGAVRFTITGMELWKNAGNIWNRISCGTYTEFVSADSRDKFFSGSGSDGLITKNLLIGTSLNEAQVKPRSYLGPPSAFATYHSTFRITENVVVEFPIVEGKASGAFAMDDYYLRPVEKGTLFNVDNVLINSHSGHRSDAAVDEQISSNFARGLTTYKFAGAVLDPYGLWGTVGNWSVYDKPFFTHDTTCSVIQPLSENAASCSGVYFGILEFYLDLSQVTPPWLSPMEISVDRLDNTNTSTVIGNWHIDASAPGKFLQNMRHFAAADGGTYLLDFPSVSVPTDVLFHVDNMSDASDEVIIAVRFEGTITARVYTTTWSYPDFLSDTHALGGSSKIKHDYTEVDSLAALQASFGESFWQDSANNLVWLKIIEGGLVQHIPLIDRFSVQTDYNKFAIRIW